MMKSQKKRRGMDQKTILGLLARGKGEMITSALVKEIEGMGREETGGKRRNPFFERFNFKDQAGSHEERKSKETR